MIAISIIAVFWIKNSDKKEENTLAYTDLIKELSYGNIEKIEIPELGGQRIVISLGSCFYTGEEAVSFDELYRKADTAMYESKKVQGYSATIYGIDKIIL